MDTSAIEEMQAKQANEAAMNEQRALMMDQILEPEAKIRLSRLAIVKQSHARKVEDSLIQAAKSGQLRSKVTEKQLIELLENVSGGSEDGSAKTSKIVVQRRKYFDDDEEDDDSDLL